ncbi:MAG: hypothetical protein KGZ79_09005 [Dethiobacter sp.]|nr:hypothetical protein [Dethiobacter sp.]
MKTETAEKIPEEAENLQNTKWEIDVCLEAERLRLYMLVNQLGFNNRAVLKQSNILDSYIIDIMKK